MKKVLIIDDEPLLVKSMCLSLKYKGFETYGAKDGIEGIAMAESSIPDVILLDIMMPGIDGWETLKKLKENSITKEIPVILFTAREYSKGSTLAKEHGAVDMITKPIEPKKLALILNNLDNKTHLKG